MKLKIISTSKLDKIILEKAKKNGVKIYDYDFVKITYLFNKDLIEKINSNTFPFVFTSQNAIKSLINLEKSGKINLKTRKAYSINGTTSDLAVNAGFDLIGTGKKSFSLAKEIFKKKEVGVFHLTSNIRRKEIYDFLTSTGITIIPGEIYRKKLTNKRIFRRYDAVLFFSPSQVDSFFKNNKISENATIFCIGETTKKHLKKFNFANKLIVAKESRKESMMNEIVDYYNNHNSQNYKEEKNESIFKEFINYFKK